MTETKTYSRFGKARYDFYKSIKQRSKTTDLRIGQIINEDLARCGTKTSDLMESANDFDQNKRLSYRSKKKRVNEER